MKQLLFLLLFPCLAMAQYPGNGGQKITLGEQTTADGLVYRGLAADTTRKPSVDTMAYILLDTNTNIIWQYKLATNNAWTRVGGSISSGLTGVLPVANGGTNTTTLTANKVMVGNGTSGVLTPTELHWDNTAKRLGIGTSSPTQALEIFDGLQGYNQIKISNISGNNQTRRTGIVTQDYAGSGLLSIFRMFSNESINQLSIGGGIADKWLPTQITFHTGIYNTSGASSVPEMVINDNGNIGIGTTTPTARLQISAGTATAGTAPLKFTSGTNLTTAEAGAVEFNGTNLLFTPSTTRHTVNHGLTGSATLDFPSTTTLLSADLTITVTGAADGDVVSLGVPNAAVNANTSYSAWVSAANTVTVRFNNYSSGTVNPASGTFKVFVTK